MAALRAAELRSVLEFAELGLALTDFRQVEPMLGALSSLVGSDSATLTHMDLAAPHEVAVLWPASRAQHLELDGYARVATTHPLRRPLAQQARARSASPTPVRISDLLTRRQWRSTPVYCESRIGADDQMTHLLATAGPAVHAVTLARSQGAFTERQRDLLASCARHLAAGVARARRTDRSALQLAPVPTWVSADDAPGLASRRVVVKPVLSPREQEVLRLVATGLTDAQVARRLGLQPATVSKHLCRIYARLGVPNRAAAVRHWLDSQR